MGKVKTAAEFTMRRYESASEKYKGWCRSCNAITAHEGVEPDARNYPCKRCKKETVFGIEEALMMGMIWLV